MKTEEMDAKVMTHFSDMDLTAKEVIEELPDLASEMMNYYLTVEGYRAISKTLWEEHFVPCGSYNMLLSFSKGDTRLSFLKSTLLVGILHELMQDNFSFPYEYTLRDTRLISNAKCLFSHLTRKLECALLTSKYVTSSAPLAPSGETNKEPNLSESLPANTEPQTAMLACGSPWDSSRDLF